MPGLTDVRIHQKGLHVLVRELGEVDAFRFLAQMSHEVKDALTLQDEVFRGMSLDEIYERAQQYEAVQEHGDHAKWRRHLLADLTIEENSAQAMAHAKSQEQ
jgi:hypothetical protein